VIDLGHDRRADLWSTCSTRLVALGEQVAGPLGDGPREREVGVEPARMPAHPCISPHPRSERRGVCPEVTTASKRTVAPG
jgi:hypothetical protein